MSYKLQKVYGFIKGGIGESIVVHLFENLKIDIHRYGYEVILPELAKMKRERKVSAKAIKSISTQADFLLILNRNTMIKLEVKYRRNQKISYEKLDEYEEDVSFLFIDNENFWFLSPEDLKQLKARTQLKTLKFECLTKLEDHPDFDFTPKQKQLIVDYKALPAQVLGNLESTLEF